MIEIGNAQIIGERENQEDYFATVPILGGYLCVVADGMGGYEGGEIASQICVKDFIRFYKDNTNKFHLDKLLLEATHYAHSSIKSTIKENPSLEDMGTTLVSAIIKYNGIMWVNVGDSPMYRFRKHTLQRINANHSVAGDLEIKLNNGEITQQEFDTDENKHMLTSAITCDDIPILELQDTFLQVENDDIYILASDGIHSISDDKISSIISKNTSSAQSIAQNLIDAVEQKNVQYQDNTTIIVAKINKKG